MQSSCTRCGTQFEITLDDLAFYEKISPSFSGRMCNIPPPRQCPPCRLQRRLTFINQLYVYTRPSSISDKRIFSMFPEKAPFPVYENEYWWSDAWDALQYGREPDLNRSFFSQYEELGRVVPHFALMVLNNEDCDYCNNVSQNKHCYLCFNTRRSEHCIACERTVACTGCVDCTDVASSERCLGCVSCTRCYDLQESQECIDCSESFFLLNCRSCRSCFGCTNLRHAEYRIFNEQHTKAEYDAFMKDARMESYTEREKWRQNATAFWQSQPRPHAVMNMVEHVSGNYLCQCKNVQDSYFVRDSEDLRFCSLAIDGVKNCYDFSTYGDQVEYVYESARCGNRFARSSFCYYCYDGCSDLYYCSYCVGCQDCFGCVGLRKKRYCILNKQYSKEEYESLVPTLIARMRSDGEWGEFFPITSSPNPYNHTFAQRYFPLTKEEVRTKGLTWEEDDAPERKGVMEADALPDIASDDGQSLVVKSIASRRPFSITSQEIQRYVALHAPLPRTTYAERMEERAETQSGMRLYDRHCAKTGKPIRTAISPETPWIVWDKDEYEKEFSA